jgi:hypothetical protein
MMGLNGAERGKNSEDVSMTFFAKLFFFVFRETVKEKRFFS